MPSTQQNSPPPDSRRVLASIERVEQLTGKEFEAEYVSRRRPVILTDATRDWSARGWTPDSLKTRAGHRIVTMRTEQGPRTARFAELLSEIVSSPVDAPAAYIRNVDIQRELPELWPDVRPRLALASPDWKSSRWLPRDFLFANHLEELFIGGPGNRFPKLHVDYWGMDGFISQIFGTKEVTLIAPKWSDHVYPSSEDSLASSIPDIESPDLTRFPKFAEVEVQRVVLQPGETLYNPNGWWHTTYMPDISITVITASWNRSNWPVLIREYRRRGKGTRLQRAVMLVRLLATGLLNRVWGPQ